MSKFHYVGIGIILTCIVLIVTISLYTEYKVEICDTVEKVNCEYEKCRYNTFDSGANKETYIECLDIKSMEEILGIK